MAAIGEPDGSISESGARKVSSTTDPLTHAAQEAFAHPVVATGALTDHSVVSGPAGGAGAAKVVELGARVLGPVTHKEAEIERLRIQLRSALESQRELKHIV